MFIQFEMLILIRLMQNDYCRSMIEARFLIYDLLLERFIDINYLE
jgi:hypothetical protein